MKFTKNSAFYRILLISIAVCGLVWFYSCSSFNYKTYNEKENEGVEDPEPNYDITLDKDFQDYTNFMFIGNRVENFGTYFNTYYNAKENYDDAYDIYITRVLSNYGNRIDSVYITQQLSQEAIDLFNKAIEKASKVIQFHKSSALMDRAVLLIGKSYFYLGDYIKAERKFNEFSSKLSKSIYLDENLLFYSKTQLRLGNYTAALKRLDDLIKNTKSNSVKADAYQSIAEYYLSKKDYAAAVENYTKAIEFSRDSEFKAQMQYLLATVAGQTDNALAAKDFEKVLDFNASFDLEFLAKLNRLRYLILAEDFVTAKPLIENLRVKYKDVPEYAGQVEFLQGFYYEQKKNMKQAVKAYNFVMRTYPKSQSSADASYQVAKYHEGQLNDYLNAYRYYKFSTEESSAGKNYRDAQFKVKLFKQYYELRSVIAGKQINTDYDSLFNLNTKGVRKTEENEEGINPDKNRGGDLPKPGGYGSVFSDSLSPLVDSANIKSQKISKAKFELAELFDYDLKKPDSSEYYYKSAFEESDEYDFKSRVLYALAGVYRGAGQSVKADEVLHRILTEFPLSPIANEVKIELKIPIEDAANDPSDSLYLASEDKFNHSDYAGALDGYKQVAENYPATVHGIKSSYSAGWIYENILFKPDSAYYYYSRVVFSGPRSDYAAAVSEKVKQYEESKKAPAKDSSAVKDSSVLKDSSMVKDSSVVKDSTVIKDTSAINQQNIEKKVEGTEIKEDPGKINEPVKDMNNPDLKKEEEVTPKKDDPGDKQ